MGRQSLLWTQHHFYFYFSRIRDILDLLQVIIIKQSHQNIWWHLRIRFDGDLCFNIGADSPSETVRKRISLKP